jgi:hypothetical protein
MRERVSWHIPDFDTDWIQIFGYVNVGERKLRIYIYESHMIGHFYVEVDEYITANVLDKRLSKACIDCKDIYKAMRYAQDLVWNNFAGKELANA